MGLICSAVWPISVVSSLSIVFLQDSRSGIEAELKELQSYIATLEEGLQHQQKLAKLEV